MNIQELRKRNSKQPCPALGHAVHLVDGDQQEQALKMIVFTIAPQPFPGSRDYVEANSMTMCLTFFSPSKNEISLLFPPHKACQGEMPESFGSDPKTQKQERKKTYLFL